MRLTWVYVFTLGEGLVVVPWDDEYDEYDEGREEAVEETEHVLRLAQPGGATI